MTRGHPGIIAGIVGLVGLVGLFAARSSREAAAFSPDEGVVVERESGTTPGAARTSESNEDSGAVSQTAGNNPPASPCGADGGADENADVEIPADDDEKADPETVAALKEQFIEEKFGVILRQGKWIPTVGGGTNLVYITTGSLPPGKAGELYEAQFHVESGWPPYQWNIAGGSLPSPILFDGSSGRLSGIPDEPSTTVFFLEVTDSNGAKDVAEYTLTFQPEQSLEIVTENLPAAFPGADYFVQLQAAGGVPPYAWSAAGDVLDVGTLVLDSQTGQIHGEIGDSAPEVDIPLVFWLSDAQARVSKELVLHVRTKLSILDVPSSPVSGSDAFEFSFQATGGTEPYIWGLSTALPPGLELSTDGLLAGRPSEPGLYDISLWVQDEAGQVDAAQFALEILPAADSIANFEALLSRNSVALSWDLPETSANPAVRIVRKSTGIPLAPQDGETVYYGSGTACLDGDVGRGSHYYAAFLEENRITVTAAPPPVIYATLPPETDPFADRLVSKNLLHPNAFRSADLPQIVLGAPRGTGLARGSLDVVSLGAATCDDGGASAPYGGTITLEFTDNVVWDGPGADFTIFENVFYVYNEAGVPDPETRFMEPAVVSVSQDGVNWRQFKIDFSPRYDPESGALNLRHPYCYNSGFAGVNPVMSAGCDPDPTDPAVSGGDSFDISILGFDWIRYVRIQSTGSRWLVDDDGDLVYHNEETGAAARSVSTSGFDLDAVTAIWMQKVASQ